MKWCLPQFLADPFIEKIKNGEITPEKMKEMSPAERHKYFSDLFGEEHGTRVNALLESKLILKDWQRGMVTWAKNITGGVETKRDLISKILKLEKVLNPAEEKQFMHDLAVQSLGVEVTFEQAKKIVELAKIAKEKQFARDSDIHNRSKWIDYGNSILELDEYAQDISPKDKTWKQIGLDVLGIPQAAQTSFDFSFTMRQGWGSIATKEFWQGFKKQFGYAFDETSYKKLMAEIRGSPYFDQLKSDGLRLTELHGKLMLREETMQTTLVEKIPFIGKFFKGSQQAYTGFANYLRFNRAINLLEAAKLEGRDISKGSKLSQDIMKVMNDFTGSGDLGKGDKYKNVGPLLNTILYSARNLKATINILNPATYIELDPFARKVALKQFSGSLGVTLAILGFAKIMGVGIETNPESSEFGKMKFGDTVVDVTGGKSTMVILLARLLTGKTKGITGKTTVLGEKYGSSTRLDVLNRFVRTKLAPIPSFMADLMAGKDVVGNPVNTPSTITEDLSTRFYPMIVGDTLSLLKDDEYGKAFGITLLNIFGNNVMTYEEKTKGYEPKLSKRKL